MTTPDQPYPAWMQVIGQGAYELGGTGGGAGGSTAYGQSITTSQVNSLIQGPATALTNLDAVSAISDVVTMVESYLKTMPLQGLQLFQGFLPGTTAADFVDVPTAIATITSKLGLSNLSSTSADSARLMHDATILFDVFHITYEAGTSGDAPGTLGSNGQPTWYSAWNDVLAYISKVFGIPLTAPAPTIGPAITAAGTSGANGSSWSTRLTNDLTILLDVFHLTYTSTQWNNAWTDLLALFGIVNSVTAPTDPTPTIGPAISSAQSTANTGVTNAATAQSGLNTTNTNLFGSTTPASTITTSAVPTGVPASKIANVLGGSNLGADVSAVNSSATTAGTNASTAIANASTAQTKANTASTWATRLTNNLLVISDVFHLTYAAGSSGDAPGTIWSGGGTGNGKLTWYSCWNDLLGLAGTVNSTSAPVDAAPTTGTVIQANTASANTAATNASTAIASNQSVVDQFNHAMTGNPSTGQPLTSVYGNATAIPASNVIGGVGATVTYGATGGGNWGTNSISWTHTPAATDSFVDVFLFDATATGNLPVTPTVTYAGTAMSLQRSVQGGAYAGSTVTLFHFTLKITPTATPPSATVAASVSPNGGLDGASVSYFASKVGTCTSSSGGISSSAALTMSTTSDSSKRVIACYGTWGGNANWTGFTGGTQRVANGPAGQAALFIGDAAGAATNNFSVNHGMVTPAGQWCGFTIELSN